MLLKAADNLTKNDQKCWSQPGFELGAFLREKKVRFFLSKALLLSHEGITIVIDKSTKEFPISKMLLLNIGHELTYHYNGCQKVKMAQSYIIKSAP